MSDLSDSLGAGLQLAEGLQGALVIGKCFFGGHSIKSRVEMLVGFRNAILFQQQIRQSVAAFDSNKVAD